MDTRAIERLNLALTMHQAKIRKTNERQIYLIDDKDCLNVHCPILTLKMDRVPQRFDVDENMNAWAMNQMNTYDLETQAVFGIVQPNNIIYSHVVKLP
jgi:hypothetical protein